jgi:hypothetical protein
MDVVGKKVEKYSGKPFKSGIKINTVKSVINDPHLKNKKAYTFEEDDSIVTIDRCKVITE